MIEKWPDDVATPPGKQQPSRFAGQSKRRGVEATFGTLTVNFLAMRKVKNVPLLSLLSFFFFAASLCDVTNAPPIAPLLIGAGSAL